VTPLIDSKRLWASIIETAEFGALSQGGLRRLSLSPEDGLVRDWLRTKCEALGCTVRIDEVGNMFALWRGGTSALDPIAIGSHMDTQPTGGKFDGVLGVLGGLEVLRTLAAENYRTRHPLMLINWTNEEGSRFSPAMLGSGAHAGIFDRDVVYETRDNDGLRFRDALDSINYLGNEKLGSVKFRAMFELHIEQGPLLETAHRDIGVVLGVQGVRWFDVKLRGQEAHSGSTPLQHRRDALCAAARLVTAVRAIAESSREGVGTVGSLKVIPNSRNVIPGEVLLTIDLRNASEIGLDQMQSRLLVQLDQLRIEGFEPEISEAWRNPALRFDSDCIAAVRHGAVQAGLETKDLVSGAGHDAAYVARVAPTAMIFIPCKDGLSHNQAESATFEQCANGVQVLLNSVISYDSGAFAVCYPA
jgi:beta-ureidopropionase / N-carbamoyl-L-amino-acid hydrolase